MPNLEGKVKVGDKLRCINKGSSAWLQVGGVYTVSVIGTSMGPYHVMFREAPQQNSYYSYSLYHTAGQTTEFEFAAGVVQQAKPPVWNSSNRFYVQASNWIGTNDRTFPCHMSQGGRCDDQALIVTAAGQVFMQHRGVEIDLHISKERWCAYCGKTRDGVQCYTPQYREFYVNKPAATPHGTVEKQYNELWLPEKKTVAPDCQCGAWANGYQSKSMFHSSWCSEYADIPPVRPETHEELVARVKAHRKTVAKP